VRAERFGLEGAVLDGDLQVDGELRTGFVWVDGRSGGIAVLNVSGVKLGCSLGHW
jgi:hypothetical protein